MFIQKTEVEKNIDEVIKVGRSMIKDITAQRDDLNECIEEMEKCMTEIVKGKSKYINSVEVIRSFYNHRLLCFCKPFCM